MELKASKYEIDSIGHLVANAMSFARKNPKADEIDFCDEMIDLAAWDVKSLKAIGKRAKNYRLEIGL